MANNYFISSVTLYKEDNAKPFTFGPIATAFIKALSTWFDYELGIGVCDENVAQDSECVLTSVYEMLTGKSLYDSENNTFIVLSMSTMLPLLNKHYGNDTWATDGLKEYMTRYTTTEGYFDFSDVITIAKLENPDCNVLGYSESYCSYCDKLRHDEFFGGGLFISDVFSIVSRPSCDIEHGHNITKCIMSGDFEKAGADFWAMFRNIINQIKQTSVQETILQHLKSNIDKELEARQQIRFGQMSVKKAA